MTPEKRRDFERQWPALSRRVEGMLVRKGVPACRRDDILQETALRLIRVWDKIDPLKSVPGLATTIALNLVRDESRRRTAHEDLSELSEVSEPGYVEAAGLARVELGRVRTAMNQLSPAQRDALLAEIGDGSRARLHGPNAEKMLRLRARKKLMAAMERVSGALLLRLRRTNDVYQLSTSGIRDAFVQGVSCLGCVAIGLMVGLDARLASPAEAATKSNVNRADSGIRSAELDGADASALRSAGHRQPGSGTIRNRVVKPNSSPKLTGRPSKPNAPNTTAPKPEAPEDPPGTELPVEVPETGVEPPAPLPVAPEPKVPEPPGVPAPPVPAPPLPENQGVGKVIKRLVLTRLPPRSKTGERPIGAHRRGGRSFSAPARASAR